jgi:hypothetical protein
MLNKLRDGTADEIRTLASLLAWLEVDLRRRHPAPEHPCTKRTLALHQRTRKDTLDVRSAETLAAEDRVTSIARQAAIRRRWTLCAPTSARRSRATLTKRTGGS